MRRVVPFIAVAASTVLLAGGCSDDLTCPVVEPVDTLPYVSASVVQNSDDRGGSTHAEVVCTADPSPSLLIAFINGRELPYVGPSGDLSALATLDDDVVIWRSGTSCVLEVTTNYGYATATAVVPDAAVVIAPVEISLGDTLTLTWGKATGADYYEVSGILEPDAGASNAAVLGGRDTLTLSTVTRDTFAVFAPEVVALEGIVVGTVTAVTGPFPESGAQGNVSGDGWGLFTLRYADPGSAFVVVVSNARDETPNSSTRR
ncbi:MAG: hypothetical protein ABIE42_02790 [Candidatus Eisenbacteria bacterium]